MLYFAYGSNLSHKQMRRRCPGFIFLEAATLHNYELQFDGYSKQWQGAVANAVPKVGSLVRGGLFEITPAHLDSLDKYEGSKYTRQELAVERDNGQFTEAIVYLRSPLKIGTPSKEYLEVIESGRKDCRIVAG